MTVPQASEYGEPVAIPDDQMKKTLLDGVLYREVYKAKGWYISEKSTEIGFIGLERVHD